MLNRQRFVATTFSILPALALVATAATAGTVAVSGTKTVAGTFAVGGTVTYTVTLTNSGSATQGDNPSNELLDSLPPSLTVVNASASSGTAAVNFGTNAASWNGSIPPAGSVTITITATINGGSAGTTIDNQGQFFFDADNNGVNESLGLTDDPGVGGATDPTSFAVLPIEVTGTKTASGSFAAGSTVTYTVTLSNIGAATQGDNPGNELLDSLPASLTVVNASASSGTAAVNFGTNAASWNGSIPPGGSVTITITATINGAAGTTIDNQGQVFFDANNDGANESLGLTDDPAVGGATDPTSFVVVEPIPTLSGAAALLLALALAGAGVSLLRRIAS